MQRLRPRFLRSGTAVLGVGALLIVATCGLAVIAAWRAHDDAIDDWRRFLASISRLAGEHADQTVAAADVLLARTVDMVERAGSRGDAEFRVLAGTRPMFETLQSLQRELPQVDVVALVSSDGEILNFSRSYPPPLIRVDDRDYFAAHRADPSLDLYLSTPVRNRGSGAWTFYLARKLRSTDGTPLGTALIGIESRHFERFYRTIEFGQGEPTMTLTRRDGRVLARYPADEAMMTRRLALSPPQPVTDASIGNTYVAQGPRQSNPADTRMRIVAPVASTQYPINVGIVATEDVVLANWRHSVQTIAIAAALASLAIAVFTASVYGLLRRRQQMLLTLEVARASADQANRAKTAFLTSMSHEIRTPMNGVLGMTELLLKTPLDARQHEMASAAYTSGRTLLGLINDVLDITKIEAGRVELERVDFDLMGLVDELVALFRAPAASKGVRLACSIAPGTPQALHGDPMRLKQILTNLLGNALKFTSNGAVDFEVDGTASAGGPGSLWMRFVVRDTGIGIPAQALEHLFEPFSQADRSTTRRYGGSGLGLAIARDLAGMMGGRIEVDSQVGEGSSFTLMLPLEAARVPLREAEPPPPVPAPPPLPRLRVLLAEDNPINSAVALAMLESLGLQVDCVTDGAKALAQARATPYAAVLMDCQMPEMDGFEATRRLRQAGLLRLPIIALTANAVAGDRERCLDAGMNDYLPKPYNRADLERVLRRWLEQPQVANG